MPSSEPPLYAVRAAGSPSRAAAVRQAAVTAHLARAVAVGPSPSSRSGGPTWTCSRGRRSGAVARPASCLAAEPEVTRRAPGLAHRDDRRAGAVREPGEASVEGARRRLGRVPAVRQPALRVDEDVPALFQRLLGENDGPAGAGVAPVDGDVPLAGEGAAEYGDAPEPGGRHDDGPGAEAAERRQDDRGVRERGVVGGDDAGRGQYGVRVGGERQPPEGGHQLTGKTAEHGDLRFVRAEFHRSAPSARPAERWYSSAVGTRTALPPAPHPRTTSASTVATSLPTAAASGGPGSSRSAKSRCPPPTRDRVSESMSAPADTRPSARSSVR